MARPLPYLLAPGMRVRVESGRYPDGEERDGAGGECYASVSVDGEPGDGHGGTDGTYHSLYLSADAATVEEAEARVLAMWARLNRPEVAATDG